MNNNGNGRRRNNRNSRDAGRKSANNQVQPRLPRSLGVVVTKEKARMQVDPIRNGIRVRNREIIKVITRTATTGAIPFGADGIGFVFDQTITTQPASPGNGGLGPYLWVGQLATLYDKYIIKKLNFNFVSSLPFTSAGQVGMYFDSDPDTITPTNFQQLSGNVYADSVHISQDLNLVIRPNQVNRLPQYQTSSNQTGTSVDTARAGWLFFVNQPGSLSAATTGVLTLGTLWMEYELEFINPSNPQTAQAALRLEGLTDKAAVAKTKGSPSKANPAIIDDGT